MPHNSTLTRSLLGIAYNIPLFFFKPFFPICAFYLGRKCFRLEIKMKTKGGNSKKVQNRWQKKSKKRHKIMSINLKKKNLFQPPSLCHSFHVNLARSVNCLSGRPSRIPRLLCGFSSHLFFFPQESLESLASFPLCVYVCVL